MTRRLICTWGAPTKALSVRGSALALVRASLVLCASLLSVSLLASPATARDLTSDEAARLEAVVESFEVALETNDIGRLMRTLPPRMLASMAEGVGVGVEELIAAVELQVAQAASQARFENIVFDGGEVRDVGEAGPDLLYGRIPLSFEIVLDDARYAAESEVLALRDDGEWYLLRVDSPQQREILIGAYPALSDLALKQETLRQID